MVVHSVGVGFLGGGCGDDDVELMCDRISGEDGEMEDGRYRCGCIYDNVVKRGGG